MFFAKKMWGYLHVRYRDWKAEPSLLCHYRKNNKYPVWCFEQNVIRHAGGEMNGLTYSNSKEAILCSIQKGDLLIELDFALTQDRKVVLSHDDLIHAKVSYKKFMEIDKEQLTPMDLKLLIQYMGQHDFFVIFDCKGNQQIEILKMVLRECIGREQLLERFVIQFYNYEGLKRIQEVYPFENYIFTLYDSELSIYNSHNIIKFCLKNNIAIVTMPKQWIKSKRSIRLYNKYGINVWVHTVNEVSEANKYKSYGVSGIYSDFLNTFS